MVLLKITALVNAITSCQSDTPLVHSLTRLIVILAAGLRQS